MVVIALIIIMVYGCLAVKVTWEFLNDDLRLGYGKRSRCKGPVKA